MKLGAPPHGHTRSDGDGEGVYLFKNDNNLKKTRPILVDLTITNNP